MAARMRPPFSSSLLASQTICARRAHFATVSTAAILVVASLLSNHCAAFPSGAPDSACKELKPGHGGEARTGSAPFELVQDRKDAAVGDQIKGNYSLNLDTDLLYHFIRSLRLTGRSTPHSHTELAIKGHIQGTYGAGVG